VTVRGLDAVGRTKEEYLNLADAAVADLTNESGLTERQADRFVDLIIGPPLPTTPTPQKGGSFGSFTTYGGFLLL